MRSWGWAWKGSAQGGGLGAGGTWVGRGGGTGRGCCPQTEAVERAGLWASRLRSLSLASPRRPGEGWERGREQRGDVPRVAQAPHGALGAWCPRCPGLMWKMRPGGWDVCHQLRVGPLGHQAPRWDSNDPRGPRDADDQGGVPHTWLGEMARKLQPQPPAICHLPGGALGAGCGHRL